MPGSGVDNVNMKVRQSRVGPHMLKTGIFSCGKCYKERHGAVSPDQRFVVIMKGWSAS